jgi:hypothetical protein
MWTSKKDREVCLKEIPLVKLEYFKKQKEKEDNGI